MAGFRANESEAPERLSKVLTDLVSPGQLEPDVAGALASHPSEVNAEHFWAAVSHLAGLSPSGRANATHVAEELVRGSIEHEEALHACPNCAALWGFGRLHGVFSPAPFGSLVGAVAEANGLSEHLAAYVLAAQRGSSLGRLAWGRARAGGVATKQCEANAFSSMRWAELPEKPSKADLSGCLEALETAMAVASSAVRHEHTLVPQPVDLDYVRRTRYEDHQNYALASQLAADGSADGLAAKAEMLYYGKEQVVPQMPTPSAGSESSGFHVPVVPMVLVLVAVVGPFVFRTTTRLIRYCGRKLTGRSSPGGSVQSAADSGAGSRTQVIVIFLLRIVLLLFVALSWWVAVGSGISFGPLLKNEDAALDLFAEAATAGHWGAAYALAMLKLDGENRSEATQWLEQVVTEGDGSARAMAQHFRHRFGLGVLKDAVQAGEFLQEAADMGEINAALLLAEAYAHDPEQLTSAAAEEVEPPGGRNLSNALHYYRKAAAAGRLTCRYNIGVILVKNAGQPQEMPISVCREAYAEFISVATDLDPTVRLLFALAVRQWERGDPDAALALFMMLSEVGSEKAHRNAAQIWEERATWTKHHAPTDDWMHDMDNISNLFVNSTIAEIADDFPEECVKESSDEGDTLQFLHDARFCCPSGTCDDPGWLSNDGGLEPQDCAARCRAEPKCSFITFYAMTGYCQLSTDCSLSHPAGDQSAQTFAIVRAQPHCKEKLHSRRAEKHKESESPIVPWCWPSWRIPKEIWHCSAVYQLRATDLRGERDAAGGSAIAAGARAAEDAMISAAKNLQHLDLFAHAKAWSCRAADRFNSEHGRLLCAALEAESWEDHPRNLTAAAVELDNVARNGSISASITAYTTLALACLRFLGSIIVKCQLQTSGQVLCPELEVSATSWSVDVAMLASVEKVLTICVPVIIASCIGVCILVVRGFRRLLKPSTRR